MTVCLLYFCHDSAQRLLTSQHLLLFPSSPSHRLRATITAQLILIIPRAPRRPINRHHRQIPIPWLSNMEEIRASIAVAVPSITTTPVSQHFYIQIILCLGNMGVYSHKEVAESIVIWSDRADLVLKIGGKRNAYA